MVRKGEGGVGSGSHWPFLGLTPTHCLLPAAPYPSCVQGLVQGVGGQSNPLPNSAIADCHPEPEGLVRRWGVPGTLRRCPIRTLWFAEQHRTRLDDDLQTSAPICTICTRPLSRSPELCAVGRTARLSGHGSIVLCIPVISKGQDQGRRSGCKKTTKKGEFSSAFCIHNFVIVWSMWRRQHIHGTVLHQGKPVCDPVGCGPTGW